MTLVPPEEQSYVMPPPVVPYPELLPLDAPNFTWDRFEAFCEELISRLPGVKDTHRYGRRGSNQRGIDIFADLDNGERWAFQCKQWQRFTKTDATKAIQETSYPANRYILMLSRPATSGVRDACNGNPTWDVWDVGDISRKVRDLDIHPAARLVEAHFGPAWRRAFLGLPGLTPFVTPDEYFQPFLNTSALFNHAWQLVGRSDHLRKAHEFMESPEQKVAILVGRGGIGKSKILHAFADTFDSKHPGKSLRFTAEGVPLTQEGADYLPFAPCVIVVDDAHRRGDLPALLALSRQRSHVTKLFLSCRPQGLSHLRSQLTQGGFDVHETVALPEVIELTQGEVRELAREALGPEFASLSDQLAKVTWDCPLVTVVGGQLLTKKAIDPDFLERDEEFRHTVLARFRDILVGEVGDRIDTSLCKNLLDLIAAVQPIRLNNELTLEREAEFLGIDRPKLVSSLDVLEEAGVLLRRGNTLRIVPDVLADHILHQMSVTRQGQATGYADLVFDKFASLCPSEVLRNLSELDWRLRRSGAQASDLLGGIWQSIEQEFQEASNQRRCTILGILKDVAVHQPEKTLELVEYAIRNPTTKSEDPNWSKIYEFTHSDVLRKLPTILRQVSYTIDFLPRCCKLLWELGRDDDRNLSPNPEHAMRVLAELGGYNISKPLAVNRGVLDTVEKLLAAPACHEHVHSPLDIIDPMLAKTGFSAHSEGHNFVYRPFTLKDKSIKSIRQRAIALVVDCLSSHSPRGTLRALRSMESALREPVGVFGMKISDEDREQWRPEQLEILTHIADLAQSSTEPVILLRIREVLWRHLSYIASKEVRDKANSIVASIPDSFELRLTQELMNPFHSRDRLPEERVGNDGPKRHRERIEQTQRALVAEFLSHYGEASTAYRILTDRIQTMTDAGVQPVAQVVFSIVGNTDPELAAGLCDIIVGDPNGALAPYLQPLLSNVRIWNAERACGISQRSLQGSSNVLCRGVASSYKTWGWAHSATVQDFENIRELLGHRDLDTRKLALGSLGSLAEASPRVAIDLAKNVELGDSEELVSELCLLFYDGWGLPFEQLAVDDLNVLLSKLESVQGINDFYIKAFLVKASALDAGAVVGLLLNRIRMQPNLMNKYAALPTLGFSDPLIGLLTSPDHESILRELRDASLEPGWSIQYWIPQLFREVSSDFESSASLTVLEEWINSGSADRIKPAAHLLSCAQPALVFQHVEFITNLLGRAHAASSDCYQNVCGSLGSSALSGTGWGTPGQPMPHDVAIRDQATARAAQFDAGSPTNRFFALLAESAEDSIKRQLSSDEELFE